MSDDRFGEIALTMNIPCRQTCGAAHCDDRVSHVATVASFGVDGSDCPLFGVVIVFPSPIISGISEYGFGFSLAVTLPEIASFMVDKTSGSSTGQLEVLPRKPDHHEDVFSGSIGLFL